MPLSSSYSLSNKGLQRTSNEDAFLDCPEQGLWVVADGMGGHEGGEIASDIVRRTLFKHVAEGLSLAAAIEHAHLAVLAHARSHNHHVGMGSTVVALKNHGEEYQVAWVGDSRAYLWTPAANGGELQQLTHDHSFVQSLVDKGSLNADEARYHPQKNIITQCLGAEGIGQLHIEMVSGQWLAGQRILLCSDGLTNEVTDSDIAKVMCQSKSSAATALTLLEAALENGGSDNITVQVIEAPYNQPQKTSPATATHGAGPSRQIHRMKLLQKFLVSLLCGLLALLGWFVWGGI